MTTSASSANANTLPKDTLARAIAASEAATSAASKTDALEAQFDADRYVLQMRLLGVKFTVQDPHEPGNNWKLSRDLAGVVDKAAYDALEAKWARFVKPDRMTYLVYAWLEEERGHIESYCLVGHDMAKGLMELRRINEQNRLLYAAETAARDEDPHYKHESTKDAVRKANEGGFRYYWLLRHLWHMPITCFNDVGLKSVLADEHGDYIDDDDPSENIRYSVIRQIADFFEKSQARKWIDGARKAGLSVFPWHGSINDTSNRGVMTFGQDMDGPNDFSAASNRFRRSRASRAIYGLREGIVFDELCEVFEVDPADPAMCDKVNDKLRAMDQARKALDHQPMRKVSA